MGYSIAYTNGVIAVKETRLLGDKLLRFPSMKEEEVLRALSESGFGTGGDPVSAEEGALDAFIREYAPCRAYAAYFLLPRDFHNRKALAKAKLLSADPAPMLAPMGLETVEELEEEMESAPIVPWERLENATGAEIGAAFDQAMYARLFEVCKYSPVLKKLLVGKVDRINILTALRSEDAEFAERFYLPGGTLGREQLGAVFSENEETRARAFAGTPYEKFYSACLDAGKPPYTGAERLLESFEEKSFYERRFGLEGKEPFLYYVFRRRAEIRNVRTVLVALRAGVGAAEIEKRLAGAN